MSECSVRKVHSCRSNRVQRASGVLTLRVLLLGLAVGCGYEGQSSLTNVVLITVDTLRADHVGAYGGTVPTPAMDALAVEGARIHRAFTPVPSTGPAVVSLLTGTHPWHHGVLLNAVTLGAGLPSLPERLQSAGFETAAFVSSYVVSARFGFDRGFDLHHFEPSHGAQPNAGKYRSQHWWSRGAKTTDAALRWLDSRGKAPFFLWVHYIDPHDPYRPPPGFERPEDEPVDLSNKRLSHAVEGHDKLRTLIRYYRGSVVYTDFQIGQLVDRLRARNLLDQTLIILTADHGEGLGDHGVLGHGRNLHDELVRVPMIFRGPQIPAGRELDGLAQLEDLMPTILSMLGLPYADSLDGVDLSPWLRGEVATSPRAAAVGRRAAFGNVPPLFYARSEENTWIGQLDGSGVSFQLSSDPFERRGQRVRELPWPLRRHADSLRSDASIRVLDEESRAGLKALGYLE